MKATIFYLSPEVREAALDLKALRTKIKESGSRGFEWFPAEANARQRMVHLSLEQGENREKLPGQPMPRPKPGEGFLKLA
jgi:hypothetical protein